MHFVAAREAFDERQQRRDDAVFSGTVDAAGHDQCELHGGDSDMSLSTGRLFTALLRPLRIDVVCDIGSLNGADALRFRRALPKADIMAFEANPHNYRAMLATPALRRARIEVLPCAV